MNAKQWYQRRHSLALRRSLIGGLLNKRGQTSLLHFFVYSRLCYCEDMSGAFNLLQLCHVPSPKFLLWQKLSKGLYVTPGTKIFPALCFCKNMQTVTCDVEKRSYVRSHQTKTKEQASTEFETVGAFQKLPLVLPSIDIFQSALKKARRESPTKGIVNIAKRARNRGAKQLDALMKELAVPLRLYVENFPNKKHFHPYERSLVELTLGDGKYEQVLRRVDKLRKKVVTVGKEQASLCAKSSSKRGAEERLMEGMEKIENVYNCDRIAVDELLKIAKTLRFMPVVDLESPTLCLVGAPNVGKSSLVRLISTGKPEICNYPFTTRGILMGHINLQYQHFQVTDTPGLLKRPDEERNNLERLTLAVLSHLPTAVLYVHDLSGKCGMSPADQYVIYKEVREKFSGHLWLDVVSKCDLLEESPVVFSTDNEIADHSDLARYLKMGPDGAIRVSVMTEEGLDELKDRVHELLHAQMNKIKREAEESNQDQ